MELVIIMSILINKKITLPCLITNNANHITVAEHVLYMMLFISKGMLHDKSVGDGLFNKGIGKIETFELLNKDLLIVGFGRIGALIKICKSFNMKVNVYDPYVDNDTIFNLGGKKINDLDLGLKNADYVSLHVPLTDETKNMINKNNLSNMKSPQF